MCQKILKAQLKAQALSPRDKEWAESIESDQFVDGPDAKATAVLAMLTNTVN